MEELFREGRLFLISISTSAPVAALSLILHVDDSFSVIAGYVFYALLLNRPCFPAGLQLPDMSNHFFTTELITVLPIQTH